MRLNDWRKLTISLLLFTTGFVLFAQETTPPPTAPALFGLAYYQNHHANDHTGITISIQPIDQPAITATTTDDGRYTIALPPADRYRVIADAPRHQQTAVIFTQSEGLPTIVLNGGDLNDDACINHDDLALLGPSLNRDDAPQTDINADGFTDAADLAQLAGNIEPDCIPLIMEPTPELTAEVTPELTPELTAEVTPELTAEVTPELTAEVTPISTATATQTPTPTSTLTLTPTSTPTLIPVTPTDSPENNEDVS